VSNTEVAPVFPPDRYGRRRAPRRARRWLPVTLTTLLMLAVFALAGWLYNRYGNPPYQANVTAVEDLTDSSVTVTFTVHKRNAGPATCAVQAKDHSGAEVGYADVPVGSGSTVSVRYPLATTAKPYAVDVLSCRRA
jgi:hypothetical protein